MHSHGARCCLQLAIHYITAWQLIHALLGTCFVVTRKVLFVLAETRNIASVLAVTRDVASVLAVTRNLASVLVVTRNVASVLVNRNCSSVLVVTHITQCLVFIRFHSKLVCNSPCSFILRVQLPCSVPLLRV